MLSLAAMYFLVVSALVLGGFMEILSIITYLKTKNTLFAIISVIFLVIILKSILFLKYSFLSLVYQIFLTFLVCILIVIAYAARTAYIGR